MRVYWIQCVTNRYKQRKSLHFWPAPWARRRFQAYHQEPLTTGQDQWRADPYISRKNILVSVCFFPCLYTPTPKSFWDEWKSESGLPQTREERISLLDTILPMVYTGLTLPGTQADQKMGALLVQKRYLFLICIDTIWQEATLLWISLVNCRF